MGTNCAPLLADLFLYSYENEFLDKLIKEGKRKLSRKFSLSYRYIDDLISFNNKRLKEFISDIYPKELTISETTESTSLASYLDLLETRTATLPVLAFFHRGAGGASLGDFCPPSEIWFENNRIISIRKEICITIDFASEKIPGRKPATKLYDRRDAFGFHIVNFPFISNIIPSAPACGVYASQFIRYACCC